jgi:hypothetical protein
MGTITLLPDFFNKMFFTNHFYIDEEKPILNFTSVSQFVLKIIKLSNFVCLTVHIYLLLFVQCIAKTYNANFKSTGIFVLPVKTFEIKGLTPIYFKFVNNSAMIEKSLPFDVFMTTLKSAVELIEKFYF